MLSIAETTVAIFATADAAAAFEAALVEACERHGWQLHAYVVMPPVRTALKRSLHDHGEI